MKAISKGSLAGCLVQLDAGSTDRLGQQNFKFLSMLITGHYSAGFLMLVYLLDRLTSSRPDAVLVTPLPKKPKLPTTPHLHQVSQPRQPSGDIRRANELNVNTREIHLVEVKNCEDTRPGHQLEASRKQHEVLCKRLKAKKGVLHTILLGVGGSIYTSHTLHHLKSSAFTYKKPKRLPLSYMLILCSMHTN